MSHGKSRVWQWVKIQGWRVSFFRGYKRVSRITTITHNDYPPKLKWDSIRKMIRNAWDYFYDSLNSQIHKKIMKPVQSQNICIGHGGWTSLVSTLRCRELSVTRKASLRRSREEKSSTQRCVWRQVAKGEAFDRAGARQVVAAVCANDWADVAKVSWICNARLFIDGIRACISPSVGQGDANVGEPRVTSAGTRVAAFRSPSIFDGGFSSSKFLRGILLHRYRDHRTDICQRRPPRSLSSSL